MVQVPTKRPFTVAEYRRIADAGVFSLEDRVTDSRRVTRLRLKAPRTAPRPSSPCSSGPSR